MILDTRKVLLWDLGGQERWRSLQQSYLKSANVVLLAFNLSDPASWARSALYVEENIRVPFVIVGLRGSGDDCSIALEKCRNLALEKMTLDHQLLACLSVRPEDSSSLQKLRSLLMDRAFALSPEIVMLRSGIPKEMHMVCTREAWMAYLEHDMLPNDSTIRRNLMRPISKTFESILERYRRPQPTCSYF